MIFFQVYCPDSATDLLKLNYFFINSYFHDSYDKFTVPTGLVALFMH